MSFLFFPLLLATPSLSQFVSAPTDLIQTTGYANFSVRYKEVPTGTCELDPNVKSFSGYVDTSENQHIFFWFFESRNIDPSEAPLTVWINGGPGSSSMIGLFQENGPCGVDIDGNVYNNPYSWSNASNMLYMDQPTQVGFSYSIPVPGYTDPNTGNIVVLPNATCPDFAVDFGTCGTYSYPNLTLTANSTDAAAPGMWATLQGFMGAFPQYSRNGFHFSTESYGGHYAPVFNEYIEVQNAKNISGAHKISLESVIIGNGWYNPIIQYQAYYNFSISPGNTYDNTIFNESVAEQWYNNLYGAGNCLDQLNDCAARGINEICSAADDFCAEQVENMYDIYSGRDEYDFRELTPDPFPYSFYDTYLNLPSTQAAIGAFVNFSDFSNAVGTAFGSTGDDGREMNTVEDLGELLKQNISVTMYHGDADYNCNWLGGEVVSEEVGAEGFGEAGYVDVKTSDGIIHGQVKQAGKFAFVRIYESGHEVPFYQPLAALEMFERAISGMDIESGEIDVFEAEGYRTVGTERSTYVEGNRTMVFEVLPTNATYNTSINGPDPVRRETVMLVESEVGVGELRRRTVLKRGGRFKPSRRR